ncbi:MAG: acyl-CoA dehydrogenase family protein [Steroidobacteraceae bacterium]
MNQALLDLGELREAVRDVLETESAPDRVRRAIEGDSWLCEQLWPQLAQLGWLGLGVSTDYDGLGGGPSELCVLYQEFGRHLTSVPLLSTLLAAQALSLAGTEAVRREQLPQIVAGAVTAAVAIDETVVVNGAVRRAGGLELSGRIDFVLDAEGAAFLIAAVRDTGGTLHLVLLKNTEYRAERVRMWDPTRRPVCAQLDAVVVPPERVLASGSRAEAVRAQLLAHARLAIAADSIGAAQRIFEQTLEYMKVRVQFDRPIGSFQALKHRAADLKVLLESSAAALQRAQELAADDDPSATLWCALAKANACEMYAFVAADCLQLHGGIGFTWDHDAHLHVKRAELNQTLFGDTFTLQLECADQLWPAAAPQQKNSQATASGR